MAKKWYQQTWAIIVLLWLFFPVGLFLMWKYSDWRSQIKWAVSVVSGLLVVVVAVASAVGGGSDESNSSVQAKPTEQRATEQDDLDPSETPAKTATPKDAKASVTPKPPSPTPLPAWKDGAPLTEESVRKALKDGGEAIRSEDLGDSKALFVDEALGSIGVVYKADSVLGETDLLSIGAQTSFSAMRALFANPRVQTVTVTLLADWIDQFGASQEEETTKSTIGRALVDSRIDWGGLEDRVYVDNKLFFCISDDFYIHPAIRVRLEDPGCLLGR